MDPASLRGGLSGQLLGPTYSPLVLLFTIRSTPSLLSSPGAIGGSPVGLADIDRQHIAGQVVGQEQSMIDHRHKD